MRQWQSRNSARRLNRPRGVQRQQPLQGAPKSGEPFGFHPVVVAPEAPPSQSTLRVRYITAPKATKSVAVPASNA